MTSKRRSQPAKRKLKIVNSRSGLSQDKNISVVDLEVVANVLGGNGKEELGNGLFIDVENHDSSLGL